MKRTFSKLMALLLSIAMLMGTAPMLPIAAATEEGEIPIVAESAPQPVADAPVPESESQPVAEAAPETPVEAAPEAPVEAPEASEAPVEAPAAPEAPETSEAPEAPEVPEAPAETPAASEAPETSEAPEAPEASEAPAEAPAAPEAPETSEEPEEPETTEAPEAPAAHAYLAFAPVEGGLAVSGCAADCEEAVVPAFFDGQPVVKIAADAFQGCDKLARVEIEEGVLEIASRAFADCAALEIVALPASLTAIAADAFDGCALTSIDAPAGSAAAEFAQAWFAPVEETATEDGDAELLVLPEIDIPTASISVVGSNTVGAGKSITLSAVISAANAGSLKPEWKLASPTSLVTMKPGKTPQSISLSAAKGLSSPVKVVVTASVPGAEATFEVTAGPLVTKVAIKSLSGRTYLNLDNVADSIQLAASTFPAGASESVTWKSNKPEIAEVSPDGVVTPGYKSGDATITATSADGSNKKATITIKVLRAVTAMQFAGVDGPLTMAAGGEQKLVISYTPAEAKNKNVEWSSSNPAVAKVSSGTVKGGVPGTATITATLKDDSRIACSVVVNVFPKATGVTINGKSNAEMDVEIDDTATAFAPQTIKLTASVQPADAMQEIRWSSSDKTAADVDENGVVTILKPPVTGSKEVKITAEATEGSDKGTKKKTTITLRLMRSVRTLSIDGPEFIAPGQTFKYRAVVTPENASNTKVTWSLSGINSKNFILNASTGTLQVKKNLTAAEESATLTIHAKAQDGSGEVARLPVTVAKPQGNFKVTSEGGVTEFDMAVTESLQLYATLLEDGSPADVVWSANPASAVSISANGLVTPLKPSNKVTITAASADKKVKATIELKITCSVNGLESENPSHLSGVTLEKGKTVKLKVNVLPAATDGKNKKIIWSSDNSSVASVSKKTGMTMDVKAEGVGTAIITATSQADPSLKVRFPVTVAGVSISGMPDSVSANGSRTFQLKATVSPAGMSQKVTWASSDIKVAAVDENTGKLEIVGTGSVKITATTTDGSDITGSFSLKVTAGEPASITIQNQEKAYVNGQKVTFGAKVLPSTANQNVKWTSSDKVVANINEKGVVTFKNTSGTPKTVTVTATHKKSAIPPATVTFTVLPKPTGLTMEKVEKYVLSNNNEATNWIQLSANSQPGNLPLSYQWHSSDNSIATVDENGLVTAVPGGTGSVIITVEDDYGNTARQELQVYPTVTALTISGPDTVAINNTIQLKAAIEPADAVQYVTWSVEGAGGADVDDIVSITPDNENLTVDVKGLKAGVVTIIATSDENEEMRQPYTVTVSGTKVESITLDPAGSKTYDAKDMDGATIKATVLPADASQSLKWSSSNEEVAVVDDRGNMTFKGEGTTVITAAAMDDSGKSEKLNVTVKATLAVSIDGPAAMKAGETIELTATVLPEIARNREVEWSVVGSPKGVTINGGKLTAAAGIDSIDVTVKATCKGDSTKSDTHKVRIQAVPVKLTISPANPVVYVDSDGTVKLTAQIEPSTAPQAVEWKSSDTSVATVENGVVTMLKMTSGTKVEITASCKDYPDKKDSVTVTVTEAPKYEGVDVEGGVKLTKYVGKATDVMVPSTFDGKPVVSLAEGLFDGEIRTKMTSLTLPEGLKQIPSGLCDGCTSLTTVTLPSTVTEIPVELCDGCTNLTTVTLSNSVTKIDMAAFRNCTMLSKFIYK